MPDTGVPGQCAAAPPDGAHRSGTSIDAWMGAVCRQIRSHHRHEHIRRFCPAEGTATQVRLRAGASGRDRQRAGWQAHDGRKHHPSIAEAPQAANTQENAMTKMAPLVFLFDVDNTLLDNDRVQAHLKEHLEQAYGIAARDRYWEILEQLRN